MVFKELTHIDSYLSRCSNLVENMTSYRIQTRAKSEINLSEGYCIEALGRELCVDAASQVACEFAKASIHAADKSGCLNDILGKASPLFSLRPLWISDSVRFRLPSLLEVDLPSWFQEVGDDLSLSKLQNRCADLTASLFELGLNTVIFSASVEKKTGQSVRQSVRISWKIWQTALDAIRAKGIKVALHFSMKQESSHTEDWMQFFEAITPLLDSFDFIFWQAGELWQKDGFQPEMLEATEYEKAKEEVRFIEKNCPKPLIYFVSSQNSLLAARQAEWLWTLAHETAKETTLAFSATAGSPFASHLPLHPFFQKLSEMPITSFPRLLPVIGIAQVALDAAQNQDFPNFAFDLYDNELGRQVHERFYGVACMIPHFPEPGSLSDLVLWVLGQRMWRPLSLKLFIEMWLRRCHPKCQAHQAISLFSRIDALLCLLDQLEEAKVERLKKKVETCTFALSELALQVAEFSDDHLKAHFSLFLQKMRKRIEECQARSSKNYK